MVPVKFTHKRFVLLAGKGGRALAAIVELTPARVDLLLRLVEGPILQRELCIEMGVVPAVVSRMLSALERLGLVKRSVAPHDRRFRIITLLDPGRKRLHTLYDGFIPTHGLATVQSSAEDMLHYDWQDELHAAGVRGEPPSYEDMRPLLRRMVSSVWNMNYQHEWFG